MYDLILIYGKPKTGKTRLAKLLAKVTRAALADLDDPGATLKVIVAHLAYPAQPLIVTMLESKVISKIFPKGSPFVMMVVDMAIHTPSMNVTKDRAV